MTKDFQTIFFLCDQYQLQNISSKNVVVNIDETDRESDIEFYNDGNLHFYEKSNSQEDKEGIDDLDFSLNNEVELENFYQTKYNLNQNFENNLYQSNTVDQDDSNYVQCVKDQDFLLPKTSKFNVNNNNNISHKNIVSPTQTNHSISTNNSILGTPLNSNVPVDQLPDLEPNSSRPDNTGHGNNSGNTRSNSTISMSTPGYERSFLMAVKRFKAARVRLNKVNDGLIEVVDFGIMQQQYMDTLLRVERQNQKIEQQLKMLSLKLRVKEDLDKTIQRTMNEIHKVCLANLKQSNNLSNSMSNQDLLHNLTETTNLQQDENNNSNVNLINTTELEPTQDAQEIFLTSLDNYEGYSNSSVIDQRAASINHNLKFRKTRNQNSNSEDNLNAESSRSKRKENAEKVIFNIAEDSNPINSKNFRSEDVLHNSNFSTRSSTCFINKTGPCPEVLSSSENNNAAVNDNEVLPVDTALPNTTHCNTPQNTNNNNNVTNKVFSSNNTTSLSNNQNNTPAKKLSESHQMLNAQTSLVVNKNNNRRLVRNSQSLAISPSNFTQNTNASNNPPPNSKFGMRKPKFRRISVDSNLNQAEFKKDL